MLCALRNSPTYLPQLHDSFITLNGDEMDDKSNLKPLSSMSNNFQQKNLLISQGFAPRQILLAKYTVVGGFLLPV